VVLIGDDRCPVNLPSWVQTRFPSAGFLAVFHESARPNLATLLAGPVANSNVAWWQNSIGEVVPDVLASAAITTPHPRIFISYKRADAQGVANQLFDALAHDNYDVFLDHYRIAPGVHILSRIRQELGDKTMVLLIESANILASRWTQFEIHTAQALRLGLAALHVPGGVRVSGLGRKRRIQLQNADFVGARFHANAEIDPSPLKRLVDELKRRHDRALLMRRQLLRSAMRDALLRLGVQNQRFDSTGLLKVTSLPPTSKSYAVWMTSRSPELGDFFAAGTGLIPGSKGLVIGLARLMEPQRAQQMDWLSNASEIEMLDEGKITAAASLIAQGSL
jgi:TIR domain